MKKKNEYISVRLEKNCFKDECMDYNQTTIDALNYFFNDPQNNDEEHL